MPHDDREHARFQPSSAFRWAGYLGEPGCSASIKMLEQIPQRPAGPAALEGTEAHELLEACLENSVSPHDHWFAASYPPEMLNGVDMAYQWFQRKRIEFPNAEFSYETRVRVAPGFEGTFDGSIYDAESRQLFIVDFKYGKHPVFAKNNPQLMSYALGQLKELRHIELDAIWLVVIQPRRFDDNPIIDEKQVLYDDLDGFFTQCSNAIQEADLPHPIYNPSESRCRYCNPLCPAVQPAMAKLPLELEKPKPPRANSKAAKEAAASGRPLAPLPALIWHGGKPISPANVAPSVLAQVAAAFAGLPAVEAYVAAVKELADFLAVEGGLELPGFKVVEAAPRAAWLEDEKKIMNFFCSHNVQLDAFMPRKLISITDAKVLLKTGLGAIPEDFAELAPRIPSGKRVLVPASDSRPSAGQKAVELFDKVDFCE